MALEYVDRNAATSWQELQMLQKKAMEELLKLQEKQNDEFVAKHGLPAQPKAQLDAICEKYGLKVVRKHIDEKVCKWAAEIADAPEDAVSRLEEHIAMISHADLKEKAEQLFKEKMEVRLQVQEVNSIDDIIDEPIAVKKAGNARRG